MTECDARPFWPSTSGACWDTVRLSLTVHLKLLFYDSTDSRGESVPEGIQISLTVVVVFDGEDDL